MTILKNGMKLNTATVTSNDLLGKGSAVPGRALASTKYITIHNTGVDNAKSLNLHKSLKDQNNMSNGRQASWHLSVDHNAIHQSIRFDWEAWHSANSVGNKNSIGIETCQWTDKTTQTQTWENCACLTAHLMKTYNIPLSNVVQHNHWSGKNCPSLLRESRFGQDWNWFISLVKKYYNGGNSVSNSMNKPNANITGEITILTDTLNVRKGNSTSYAIVKKVTKGQVLSVYGSQEGWYCLNNGEWVCGDTSYIAYKVIDNSFKVGTYNKQVVVTASALNVRTGRGGEFAKLGSLKKGDIVDIWYFDKAKDGALWGSIGLNGKTGYIHSDYIKCR